LSRDLSRLRGASIGGSDGDSDGDSDYYNLTTRYSYPSYPTSETVEEGETVPSTVVPDVQIAPDVQVESVPAITNSLIEDSQTKEQT